MSGAGVDVSIDEHFARIGSKSYAINKINSIDVKYRRPHSEAPVIIAGALCLASLTVAFTAPGVWLFWGILGALGFAALTHVTWKRSKIIEYTLLLTTSSKEIAAMKTEDQGFIQELRSKIEQAMSRAD